MRYALLAAGLLCLCGSPRTDAAELPADLAVVPGDCLGFLRISAADLWKSDIIKDFRDLIQKAGPEAISAFDKRFVPALATLDRVTVFATLDERFGPIPTVVATFTQAVDQKAFAATTLPKANRKQVGDRTFLIDGNTGMTFTFLDDKTLLVGDEANLPGLLKNSGGSTGALSKPLLDAAKSKTVFAAFNTGLVPAQALNQLPTPVVPLATTKLVTLSVELEKTPRLEVKLHYSTAEQTADAEQSLKRLCKMGIDYMNSQRGEAMKMITGDGKSNGVQEMPLAALGVYALGAMKQLEEILNAPPVTKDGNALKLTLDLPSGSTTLVAGSAISVGLLLPAVQKVRGASARVKSQNNLKQIALAMFNYEATYGYFPSAAIVDKKGKPLLSWRVTILPYIEQENLYKKFKLDEPWDSENNKKLIPLMPKIYEIPTAPLKEGETYYRLFTGKDAAFDLVKTRKILEFTDGTSNTLMAAEAAESVIWTKPEDFEYDAKKPLPKFGDFHGGDGFNAAMCDGSVRFIKLRIAEATMRALITRAGGEVINFDE